MTRNASPTDGIFEPLVERLTEVPKVDSALRAFSCLPHCLFLDSALSDAELGRYSFLMAAPFEFLEIPAGCDDPLGDLRSRLAAFETPRLPNLPPFQGGAAGLLGYDLGRSLERLPTARFDEFKVPALAIGLYDVVLAIDHVEDAAWIISQGFPETDHSRRRDRAIKRIEELKGWLATDVPDRATIDKGRLVPENSLAAQFAVDGPDGLTSNFDAPAYLAAIRQAIEYIHAGDIFQVNLSQRLMFPANDDSVSLYLRLRARNPATFAGFFDMGEFQIVSASPERFLQVVDGHVEARPIKGTRQRTSLPEADLFAGDDLQQSEKDRAENVMIVDLLRNDLSRVCNPDSVTVTELCKLETYQFVQHLVSVVRGELREGKDALDLIRASFPGGSITGAPKIRAMEIIAELEPTSRGPYCGSLGYLGFDGSMDMNILIRTITAGRGWWQIQVGGGIVSQSVPEREYEETWHKAEGMLRALC